MTLVFTSFMDWGRDRFRLSKKFKTHMKIKQFMEQQSDAVKSK